MIRSDSKDSANCRARTRRVAPVAALGISAGAALAALSLANAPAVRADVVGDAANAITAVDADPFGDVFGDNNFTNGIDNFLGPQFGALADRFVNALGFDDPASTAALAQPVDADPFGDVFGDNTFTASLDKLLGPQFGTAADRIVNALGFDDPAVKLAAAADPNLQAPDADPFGDVFGDNNFTAGLDKLLGPQFGALADRFVNALGFDDAAMRAAASIPLDRDPFGDVFGDNQFTTGLDNLLPAQFATSADQFVNLLGFDDQATTAAGAALAVDPALLMQEGDPFADLFGVSAITTALDGFLPAQFAVSADQFVDLFLPAAMAF